MTDIDYKQETTGWDGTWVPPVGAMVVFNSIITGDDKDLDGLECEVIGTGKDGEFDVVTVAFESRGWRAFLAECFSPIRSKEEIDREKAIESMTSVYVSGKHWSTEDFAAALYDAGYRLQEGK